MISVLATNIVSPLGYTTEENYQALRAMRSQLVGYDSWCGIPEPFVASMFDAKQRQELTIEGYTLFESIAIRSIEEALSHATVDVTSPRTLLILSTTKANVEELANSRGSYLAPGATAQKIARYFGFSREPIVVSNACISGVDGQILAYRLLRGGDYDDVVVCGADVVTPFVVAGFLSFKSLATEACRPFDIERNGLNLGEAAATMILSRRAANDAHVWRLLAGAMSNDAYHISAPSPKGDGSFRTLSSVLKGVDAKDVALLSVHGTATMFNDQMESKAIERANVQDLPLSALKGYYGHTLGAAGVLETIVTMRGLDDGIILGVRGFEDVGVSGRVNISREERSTEKRAFIKMISGFGGCNGALLYRYGAGEAVEVENATKLKAEHRVVITAESAEVDGRKLSLSGRGKALLTEIYKGYIDEYPKFYKMDILSRLVFVAVELLMKRWGEMDIVEPYSIVLFNASSSIVADRKHNASIENREEFYPSPSLFVYTLPNIALGEVAIKHGCMGETSLYILPKRDDEVMEQVTQQLMNHTSDCMIISGWVDCPTEDCFEADIQILTR